MFPARNNLCQDTPVQPGGTIRRYDMVAVIQLVPITVVVKGLDITSPDMACWSEGSTSDSLVDMI